MQKDLLTEKVIGLAIEVHRNLGPGLLESVYEDCLCKELSDAGVEFERQRSVPVAYKNVPLETGFRADIVMVLTYLKLGGFPKGLLLNFNTKLLKDGIKRFVM